MKRFIKPYSLLLYLLASITFFFLGMFYAGITDAAKGQGLAGGAIVFGYGIISAFFALLISIFLAYKASRKAILTVNKVLGLITAGFLLYFTWRYYTQIEA
ncbi:hypothetical protein [Hanstruepera ponticola]|uniref:hypothetical protein n=1 Tax=Hanstruepera ponticola TaxID=2042995 RepID=UPI0017836962|nr:hypothetical protein [Hanstruepera ponticola]